MRLFKKKDNDYIDIEVKHLMDWDEPNGDGCIVSDKITKEGYKVGYMFRDEPKEDMPDSGWIFMAGHEDDAYTNDSNNFHVFKLNTICNYDPDIIPYLKLEIGSCFIRIDNERFEIDKQDKPIYIAKQDRFR